VTLNLNGAAFPYRAGQSILIGAPGSTDRRAYSLTETSSSAHALGQLELLIGTNAEGRTWIPLVPGEKVVVDGPVGQLTCPDDAAERRFVFVAGGTGIAPLRAMLRESLAKGRPEIYVLYSARTADDFAYAEELEQLARSGRISLSLRVTRGSSGPAWSGERGRFDPAWLKSAIGSAAARCFICGPQAMVHEAQRVLANAGVPPRLVHVEEWCRLRAEVADTPSMTPALVTAARYGTPASL
jgi:ferredoxin-NADP reductase